MRDLDGRRLLHSLLNSDPKEFKTYGISSDHLGKEEGEHLEWMLDFHSKYGSWPEQKQLDDRGLIFNGDPDPLGYSAEKIIERKLGVRLESVLTDAALLLNKGKVDEALETSQEVRSLNGIRKRFHSYRDDWQQRVNKYDDIHSGKILRYLPAPWETFNELVGGFGSGTMNVFAAKVNKGKTWLSCILAAWYYAQGYKVALVSLETPEDSIYSRIDSVYHHLLFKDLRDADLDMFSYGRWVKQSKVDLSKENDLIIADKKQVATVNEAAAMVAQEEPDIMIVDGGYRFEARGRGTNWEKTVEVTTDIQTEAEASAIPWIVTTQQNSDSKKNMSREDHQYNIRYGREWTLAADLLALLEGDSDLEVMRRRRIILPKIRDYADDGETEINDLNSIEINWDPRNFNYTEVEQDEEIEGILV